MHELFAIRRENLRRLAKSRGGQPQFLKEIGYSKGWLSQLIGKTPERELSEKIAREIEQRIGIAPGSLDQPPVEEAEVATDSNDEVSRTLARNLRSLMDTRGINQAELARRANMAVTSVNRVFNALENNVSPRLETLAGIARGLGVQAADLLKSELPAVISPPHEQPFTVARQLARLVEDFLLCDTESRAGLLRIAAEAANQNTPRRKRPR